MFGFQSHCSLFLRLRRFRRIKSLMHIQSVFAIGFFSFMLELGDVKAMLGRR